MQFGGNGMTSGRESGFCITIMHQATHRLLCSNSLPKSIPVITQPTYSPDLAPSDFWLFHSENGQGDMFCNHGGHKIERDGRTPVNSKRSLPPVLPTMAGSMEQVCVCARVLL